jgi:hypothetical protein
MRTYLMISLLFVSILAGSNIPANAIGMVFTNTMSSGNYPHFHVRHKKKHAELRNDGYSKHGQTAAAGVQS